jgi:hypothetical protein
MQCVAPCSPGARTKRNTASCGGVAFGAWKGARLNRVKASAKEFSALCRYWCVAAETTIRLCFFEKSDRGALQTPFDSGREMENRGRRAPGDAPRGQFKRGLPRSMFVPGVENSPNGIGDLEP